MCHPSVKILRGLFVLPSGALGTTPVPSGKEAATKMFGFCELRHHFFLCRSYEVTEVNLEK